jgi:hypothetical protein
LSLGTLKYLERYHLLPSQGIIIQDTVATFWNILSRDVWKFGDSDFSIVCEL